MLRCRNVVRLLQAPLQRTYTTSGKGAKGDDDLDDKHPIRRTFRILGNDMRKVKEFFVPREDKYADSIKPTTAAQSQFKFAGSKTKDIDEFQTHCDVLVIGGGSIGSSIAFWLKEKARDGLKVVVVEKDETYKNSATKMSVNGLCQQFSLPENIQMSLFCADFIRNAEEHFGKDIPLNFIPHGNLVLASEEDAETLKHTSKLQNELGARNQLLTAERLAEKFPWLNTKGVAIGCLGLEREGWFDSWALLTNLRRAARGYGAHFVNGEVTNFEFKDQSDINITGNIASQEGNYEALDKVLIRLQDGTETTIKFALCVIAAGTNSGQVARLAHIGQKEGILNYPLPIDARNRYMYALHTDEQSVPDITMPMIVDTTGTFLRRDGLAGHYVCGHNVFSHDDSRSNNLDDIAAYFESNIRPALTDRIPSLKTAKVVNSLAGYYDSNVFDENGILGPHPYYHNLYIATGFSGQGIQQAPAVGRAISELIIDGQFRTLDLSRLSFDRLIVDKPMYEFNALN